MKSILRKIVLKILEVLAKIKLKKFDAKIIGITGSVGKTSCKEIVYSVLSKKYKVLRNKKSFNSEFGLLLTILHQESGFSSPLEWIKILFKGFIRAFFIKDKYDYLVLEMGVDKPGDMDFLTQVAPPNIALITAIKPAHLADDQFSSIDEIFEEKKKIFTNMAPKGTGFISLDDKFVSEIIDEEKPHKKISYGFFEKADFRADSFEQTENGIIFSLHNKENIYQFKAPLFGKYQISILLPAIAIGLHEEVEIQDVQEALEEFYLPPGRMSLIPGINDALILDSSYNASPEAVIESLKVLNFFGKNRQKRRVFIFGNMNELGKLSKELHQHVGNEIPKHTDMLITVGDDVTYAAEAAMKNGLDSSQINSFKTAKEAADFYKQNIKEGDVILVKGSQNNVRLEIFVKEIMKNPEKAKDLLVRQEKNWENITP